MWIIWNQRFSSSRRVNDVNPPQCTTPSHSAALYSTKSLFVADVTVSLTKCMLMERRSLHLRWWCCTFLFFVFFCWKWSEAPLRPFQRRVFTHWAFWKIFGVWKDSLSFKVAFFQTKMSTFIRREPFSIRWDREGTEEHYVSYWFLRMQRKWALIIEN